MVYSTQQLINQFPMYVTDCDICMFVCEFDVKSQNLSKMWKNRMKAERFFVNNTTKKKLEIFTHVFVINLKKFLYIIY